MCDSNYAKPNLEVADIFRTYGELFCSLNFVTPQQRKVLSDIKRCRTAELGGHIDKCSECGYSCPSYNSCRNRHCPKCQSLSQAKWIMNRTERLLPTHYFHGVFTLPAQLRTIAYMNKKVVYNLMFKSIAETLLVLAKEDQYIGGEPAITLVLHTWTRELQYHPHVHCIISGGGLSSDGKRWLSARQNYLFPVRRMSAIFKSLFLTKLVDAFQNKEIFYEVSGNEKTDIIKFKSLINKVSKKKWVVYFKRPFGSPADVIKYLGRYTHRTGISNQRLISMDDKGVRFYTKNGNTTLLQPVEFIRRFLLHVLPEGFVKIRHYGLAASGNVSNRLKKAQTILAETSVTNQNEYTDYFSLRNDWKLFLKLLTNIDLKMCPRCFSLSMKSYPLEHPVESTYYCSYNDTS